MTTLARRSVNSLLRSPVREVVLKRFQSQGSSTQPPSMNAPGLSQRVVSVPNSEVGPGASKNSDYKNPEYFCYSNMSYFEAEVEMNKYRLPQPSSKK